jgi:hypothetical protein
LQRALKGRERILEPLYTPPSAVGVIMDQVSKVDIKGRGRSEEGPGSGVDKAIAEMAISSVRH